jgi:outer membrane receptor protein involved in Fe transport
MKNDSCFFRLRLIVSLLPLLAGLSLPLAAQDATGRVIGVITDPSGSVVPRAKVTVTNVDTGINHDTLSAADGSYQVLLLPVGSYRVSAEAPGFRKTVIVPQALQINQSLKIDVKLEVGATTDTVQVEASASGVETVNSTIASSVTQTQIENAPLNGRNVMDLALLMPGVTPATTDTPDSGKGAGGFSIAGGRPDSVTYLLDGGVNNDLLSNTIVLNPNPDAIEEFRVLNSNYNAEYGRNAGGVVSIVSRSGTNTFHGSAYDYVRNGDFNANSFFNNQSGLPVDPLRRNQFGGTIGGPVIVPTLLHRDSNRLFFFVSYQGQRQSDLTSTAKINVFTPAELTGDFSHASSTGGPDPKVVQFLQQYPYFQPNPSLANQGIIDPSRINPVSQNYIKAGLIPTSSTGFLVSQGAALNNADELTGKVDALVSQKDRLTVTLGASRNPTLNPFATANVPGYPNDYFANRYSGTVAYTRTFTPNLLNEFRFNAQRNNLKNSYPATKLPIATQLGINQISDDPQGPPNLSFTSMNTGFSVQGPTNEVDNTYNWTDTLTWSHGHHNLKAGFNYTPFQNNTVYDFYVNGTYYFYGTGGGSYSQNDLADFLMGLADEYYQAPRAPSNIRTYNVAGFVQDEWKVKRNLTLTLGVRYEYNSPKKDLQGRSFSIIPGQQSTRYPNAPLGMVFPGDANAPVGSNFPDKNNWAPRFGFAWDPKGDSKTSVRGGFGVFYDILKGEDNLQFNGQEPFFAASDLYFNPLTSNPTAPATNLSDPFGNLGLKNPFPSAPPPSNLNWATAGYLPVGGGGVYYVTPNLRTPYIYQYNLSIQREIIRDTTLNVAYIGSDSHKLTSLTDGNPMVLGTTSRVLNLQSGVAPGTFSYADTFGNVGGAHYNSLAIGLSKRTGDTKIGSLTYQVSYTYGKSIDNVSGFRATSSRVPAYNWSQFVGVSDYDVTNYLAVSAVWAMPFDRAWSGGPKRLTSGWRLYPLFTYRSGLPINVRAGLSRTSSKAGPSGAGDPNLVQANLVAPINFLSPEAYQKASNGRSGNFWFDPSAFERASLVTLYNNNAAVTNPALRTYGSLGRNAFRGPDLTNVNLSMAKDTFLTSERVRLEIRADFFNLLNHTQFLNPSTTMTSSLFGQISTTNAPRIIQLSARFSF